MYPSAIPFVVVHLACFTVFWTGATSKGSLDLPGALLAANLCYRCWLSPVLFTPRVQNKPRVPVHPGLPLTKFGPEKRAVVGGKAPTSSPVLGHSNGHPLAASQGINI